MIIGLHICSFIFVQPMVLIALFVKPHYSCVKNVHTRGRACTFLGSFVFLLYLLST
uniref:Uncharacterized protein MANES_05G097000 n=1 Tax=Rhizophora mucronata TaxID=61149 RepID=A0A2P2IH32_RHIMU